MKKKTILVLLALLLALTMTVLLVACNDNPGPVDPTDQDPCKNGHVEDDGAITVQPTCQTEGTRTYRCKVCGEVVRTEPVDKTDHVWDNGTRTQEPGCGTVGKMTFRCTVEGCNETKTEDIPATGVHTKGTWVPEVSATCKKEGTHSYYQCTNCSAKLDEDGNEYDADDLVIPKAAHTWDNGVVTPATCEEEGHITYTCEVCSTTSTQTIPANGHTYGELIPQQDATCEHTGVEAHYMCSVCDKLFDQAREPVEETDLEIGLAKHTLDEVTGKPATCTEDGFETYYKCNVCNKLFADDKAETPIEQPKTLTATGHKPIPYGDKAATCTEAGYANGKICSECGTVIVQPKRVAPLGHDYVYTPVGDGVHHTVTCSRNNDYHETELCASIGKWMDDNAEYHYHKCDKCKYECDIANHTFQDKKCTVCGAVQSEVIVRVEGQLDHIEISVAAAIEYIKQNYNDGTPVTIIIGANYTANVTFDGNINVTLDLGGFGIGMSTFSLVVDGQADVTLTNGTLTGKVQFNGGKLALEGVGGSYTIALKSGLKCDKADVTVNGAPLDHAWNNGQVTTPPTCESTGTRTYTCTRCQATRTEDEPAKGHTYGTLIPQQDPTCTATGTAAHYQCADCRKLFVDENGSKKEVQADELVLDKIEHTYGKLIPQQDATCVADGHKAYFQCEVCKQYFDEEKQPAEWKDLVLTSGGHDFDTTKWKYDGTNHWYECKNDSTHHDQQAPHSWDYRKGENGSHEHYCTVCGYVDKTDATCTPAAPAPADSHDENHGLNIQDGWYADADYHWQICKDCGATINRNTHVWVGDEDNQYCQICGHKFFDVKISDGDKLDQSARTIAEAFDWITAHGDKTKTYTVTLTHNRSDDSTNTVTVPEGYKVVLVLGDYSVTYTKGKLSVGKGSELTVQGNGKFVIGTIEYSGGKLVLPDGEYNFEIKGGYTCLTADITVGKSHGLTHKFTAFEQNGDFQHYLVCSVCGSKGELVDHDFEGSYVYNGNWTHTATCNDCGKTVTSNCKPELNVCECGHTFTVDEILDKLETLNDSNYKNNWLPGTYVLSGTVTKVEHPKNYTNVWFTIDGDSKNRTVEVYGMQPGKETNVAGVIVGAKITVSGELQHYGDTLEFGSNKGKLDELVIEDVEIDFSYETDKFAYKIVSPAEAKTKYPIGTEIQFTIEELQAKWIVEQVTVNGVKVNPDENGIYKFTIEGATTVQIVGCEWGNTSEKTLARFEFGENSTTDKDIDAGSELSVGATETNNGYELKFTTCTKVRKTHDSQGNSVLKLGIGSVDGEIAFTVPNSVSKVYVWVANYKAKTTTLLINDSQKQVIGSTYSTDKGTYIKIEIDTSTSKDVKIAADGESGDHRFAIDAIEFYGIVTIDCTHPEKWLGDWNEGSAPKCTTLGERGHYTCQRCGKYIDQDKQTVIEDITIAATNHENKQQKTGKDSTCVVAGYEAYWYCPDCGKYSLDGTNFTYETEGAVQQAGVKQLAPHTTPNGFVPVPNDATKHGKLCTVCNQYVDQTNHDDGKWQSTEDAHWKVCTVCDKELDDTRHGHEFTINGNECECGYTSHAHNWHEVPAQPATCLANGHRAYWACDGCDSKYATEEDANAGNNPLSAADIVSGYKQVDHNWKSQRLQDIGDGQHHAQKCTNGCNLFYNADGETSNYKEHSYDEITFTSGAADAATHHTGKCECGETKQIEHTLEYKQLTVGGEITQDMADHQHEVSCSECDYVARENHDFGTGSKDQRHDCLCGEKLCQYGEETAHVSGTISPKESDDSNYLFPVSTDKTKSNYVDGENKLIGGITFAYNQLAHAFYNKTADVIQMRKAQDSQPAGYLYNTGAITGGVKSITITISHEKGHTSGNTTGSTIIKNGNCKVLIISFGYDTGCKELEVEVLVNEETDPQFTWTDTEGKNYTYFKISYSHANSNAVCIKSIDINYSIQEGHHVVDDWTYNMDPSDPCTSKGTRTGTCIRCGETVTEQTSAKGHNFVWLPATDADCTHPAYMGQWQCSECLGYLEGSEDIKPDAHLSSELLKERDVDDSINNGQPLGHKRAGEEGYAVMDWSTVQEKNLATEHNKHFCALCEEDITKLVEYKLEYTHEESATSQHKVTCPVCNYTTLEDHTPKSAYETNDEEHWKVCEVCQGEIAGTRIGHVYKDDTHFCECGKEDPEHAHKHTFGDVVPEKDPTCVSRGNVEYKQCQDPTCQKYFPADALETCGDEGQIPNPFTEATGEHVFDYEGAKTEPIDDGQHGVKCKWYDECKQWGKQDSHNQNGAVSQIEGDEQNHNVACSECGRVTKATHTWSATPEEVDEQNHKITCDCGAEKTEGHTFSAVEGGRIDDYTHNTKCACGATGTANHDWGKGEYGSATRHACPCGEPLCVESGELSIDATVGDGHLLSQSGYTSTSGRNISVKGSTQTVTFQYQHLGTFDSNESIQGNGAGNGLWNTTAFPGAITKITIEFKSASATVWLDVGKTSPSTNVATHSGKGTVTKTFDVSEDYRFVKIYAPSSGAFNIESITIEFTNSNAHLWGEGQVTQTGSCADGTPTITTYTCLRCGKTKQEQETVEHVFVGTPEYDGENGHHIKCQNCNAYSESTPCADEGNVKWETNAEDHRQYCTVCGHDYVEEQGHTFTYADNNDGRTHHKSCTVCDWDGVDEPHTTDGTGACTASGCTYGHNDNFQVGENGAKYADLNTAVQNANGQTIYLRAEKYALNGDALAGDFTLDLDTHTLTLSSSLTLSGTVTISNGTIEGGLVATGNLTLQGVTIVVYDSPVLTVQSSGSVNVDAACKFLADAGDSTNTGTILLDGSGVRGQFASAIESYTVSVENTTCDQLTAKVTFNGEGISHTYSEYIEIEGDDQYHKSTCDICSDPNDKLPHGKANAENKCPDCGHQFKKTVWELVTDYKTLNKNDKIIFVSGDYAAGELTKSSSNTYLKGISGISKLIVDNTIDAQLLPEDVLQFSIDYTNDNYTFSNNGNLLGISSASSNRRITLDNSGTTTWTLKNVSTNQIQITSTISSGSHKMLKFNTGSNWFANYGSMADPQIYVYKG